MKGLLEQRIFSHRDFRTYRRLFSSLTQSITPPTLLVYLNASVPTLLERINGRSRPYERAIPAEYLAQLNRRYDEWLRRFGSARCWRSKPTSSTLRTISARGARSST